MSASEAGGAATARQRLFFGLRPDPEVRSALAMLARDAGHTGRAVAAGNLHLTLAFLGGVTPEQRACMELAASGVTGPGFVVTLDQLGFWPRPRILWAGAAAVPHALGALVADLGAALAPCGYQPESRPFQAHVTLVRKASRPPRAAGFPPLHWAVADFCLFESVTTRQGSEYRVLRVWPLEI